MLYVGLDLSRKRLDFDARGGGGEVFERGAVPPDRDGLSGLVERLGDAEPVLAVIESMSGARFVHDQLELQGWQVRIADAAKARGLAPLACKTDKIDCWVLAELARLDLVPELWLPDPSVRAEPAQARRLHRPLPESRAIRRTRPPRPAAQERTPLPALGADRSRPHRRPPPPLPTARRADARPPRQKTRQQDRRDRDRPPPNRG